MELSLPFYESYWWPLVLFVSTIVILCPLFIKAYTLPLIFWKRLQYFVLIFGFLGVISVITSNRIFFARSLFPRTQTAANSALYHLQMTIKDGTGPGVCRHFESTKGSHSHKEFNKIKNGYTNECKWFKLVSERFDKIEHSDSYFIDKNKLLAGQPHGGDGWYYDDLKEALSSYNSAANALIQIRAEKHTGAIPRIIQMFAPTLIALALALSFLKSMAEIYFYKSTNRANNR